MSLLTCKICQHGCKSDGKQYQANAEALPGAPVLASLIYVKSGRGVWGIVGVVRRRCRPQREDGHHQGSLLGARLQGCASRGQLLT